LHQLDLSDKDSIQLLTGGILQSSLRATALPVATNTLDVFLEMRHIIYGISETEKRGTTQNEPQKSKETMCKNCGKKEHHHKECRAEATCLYCKGKGHKKFDCPILKRKDHKLLPAAQSLATTAHGSIVNKVLATLEVNNPFMEVNEVNGKKCNLLALVDTSSPVSFIKVNVLLKYKESSCDIVKTVKTKLRNLNSEPLDIEKTRVKITLTKLHSAQHNVDLFA